MKTKILISIIFTYSLFQVQAQVFPESDATWNIQIDGVEHYFRLSGDTIINDSTYNKLYLLNNLPQSNLEFNNGYIGGFRQENKRVWFRPNIPDDYAERMGYDNPQYPKETLLYDFSKNVGDTIWHSIVPHLYIYYWQIEDSIAASIITSTEIDEQEHKIYHTRQYVCYNGDFSYSGREDTWIEGIGSIEHGLFWFLSQKTISGYPKFHLACFKQGNEVKYMNNTMCNSCFCGSTNISKINNISLEIVQEDNYILVKGEALVFPCELKVFSLIGQLILEKKLLSDKEKISINLLKGIYLYQAQKNNEIVKIGKIMIK